MSLSLVSTLRQKYTDCVSSVESSSKWKICVLDAQTEARLSSVLKLYDLLEHSVQQIDRIDKQRNAFPRLEAVYILSPSRDNIARLIRDFEPARPAQPATKKTPASLATQGPKYAAAHLFFIDSISDQDSDRLLNSPVRDYLKTFKEIYLSFWALEAQVFSLQRPEVFWSLYAPSSLPARDAMQEWNGALSEMAQTILNICATLNEFPDIRYYDPKGASRAVLAGPGTKDHPTTVLANKVYQALKQYQQDNEGALSEGDASRPRSVLFITDRSMDLAAPLLHEFTYQAMCNDLLPIEDGSKYRHSFRNEQGTTEETEATLNDDDKVWVDVRHMHMKDALDTLVAAFRQFNQEHGGSGGSSINDLKDMLANLPGMKESKEKLSLHLSLAEQCMALFESKKLPETAMVEQSCATGLNAEGKTPKTLVEEMVPLLDDRSVSVRDKVRIIALYILYRDGVPDEDRKRLYQHARLGMPEVDAVNNLVRLGQEVAKESSKKRKPVFKQTMADDAYDISRYQPAVKLMLEDHFAGRLDKNAFPFIGTPSASSSGAGSLRAETARNSPAMAPATSLRSARPRWTGAARSRAAEPRQRVIVFVAGGMTYSEIRTAYQVSNAHNKDVYIGSSHVITPDQFLADLTRLDRGSAGARSAPPLISTSSNPPEPQPSASRATPSPQPREQRPRDPREYAPRPQEQRPQPPQAQSSRSNGYAEAQQRQANRQDAYQQPTSFSRDPRGQQAPRATPQSAASQDFVPQLRAPPSNSNNLQPPSVPHGIKHTVSASSMTSEGSQPPEKKKKGLFGRLKV